MRPKYKVIALLAIAPVCIFAQTWTWLHGANTYTSNSAPATYGTLGVSSPSVCTASQADFSLQKDGAGNVYVFGGHKQQSNLNYSNTLWKYNETSNQWTWLSGANTSLQPALFGLMGTPATTNIPGARKCSSSWMDNSGNFWVFGGEGMVASAMTVGSLNDLWRYNTTTNEWTWMQGWTFLNQNGAYGTVGVPSIFNNPGGRESSAAWKDAAGNFWLFGGLGFGISGNTLGYLSDVWRYNPATNAWANMAGNQSTNQLGVYGTQGVASTTNCPGGRARMQSWIDNSGMVWIFGGYGYDAAGTLGYLNDLWRFNPSTNEWTWMKGSNLANQQGSFGTLGVTTSSNNPSSRHWAMGWIENGTNLMLYGGVSPSQMGGTNPPEPTGDFWKYETTTNNWTWVAGSSSQSAYPVYGVITVPSLSNTPGSRYAGAIWSNGAGDIWVYGGIGRQLGVPSSYYSNTIFHYEACTAPPAPPVTATNFTTCANDFTAITALSDGTVSWYSTPTGGTPIATFSVITTNGYPVGSNTLYAQTAYCLPSIARTPVIFTVVANPTVSVSNYSICAGQSITIVPFGASTFSITGGSFTVQPVVSSTYAIAGTSLGCSSSNIAISNVSVIPLPPLSISGSTAALCAGNSTTLQAGGANTYSWSTGATQASISLSPTVTSTYTILGTNIQGCSKTISFSLNVSPIPTVSCQNASVCSGSSLVLLPSGAFTYTYLPAGPLITPTSSGTYSIIGVNQFGCVSQNTALVSVSVQALPVVNSYSPASVCKGVATTLSLSGNASNYTWSNGNIGPQLTVTLQSQQSYSIVGTSTAGCTKNFSIIVVVNSNPTITAVASKTAICLGDSVTLNAMGAASYSWFPQVSNGQAFYPSLSQSYTVIGTNQFQCSANTTVSLQVLVPPTLTVTVSREKICKGDTVTLKASGAVSYTWSTGAVGNSVTIKPNASGIYTVIGSSANACISQQSLFQLVDPCTGISRVKNNSGFTVFPNPSNGIVRLQFETQGVRKIQVFNSIGQLVDIELIEEDEQNALLSFFEKGLYTVHITEQSGVRASRKIVIE